jgi:phage FluMu gp28-like protein
VSGALSASEVDRIGVYRECLAHGDYSAMAAWLSTFWPFQRPWILDGSEMAFCNKARQIGISHSSAGVLVLWGAFHGETTTVISVGDRESQEVLDKCRKHRDVLCALGSKMAQPGRVNNASEISFQSGGRIIALPSTGGRSFTGNVYLDEFAYYPDPGKVWDAAMAVSLLGFRARISSTPNGVGNDFHHLVSDPLASKGWSRHEIPISVAIDAGYPVNIEKCWMLAKHDPRIFDQLFHCSFLDGQFQYIPTDLVNSCSFDDLTTGSGDYYGGLDIGRENDKTVLTVVRKCPDGRIPIQYEEECPRTDSDMLDKIVDDAFKHFKIKRMCVDSTGMGTFPADRMRKRHGFWKVEPVDFTLKSKEELATQLYTAFRERRVMLPRTDDAMPSRPDGMNGWPSGVAKAIREDVCSIRREVTKAGNVRYDAPRTDKGHADRAWSLALAVHAAGQAQARGNLSSEIAAVM